MRTLNDKNAILTTRSTIFSSVGRSLLLMLIAILMLPFNGRAQRRSPKTVTLLDITQRNGEDENGSSGRNVYSARYMLELAGFPFAVTASLDSALSVSDALLISSPVTDSTFTAGEVAAIRAWVEQGGIFLSPACKVAEEPLKSLYGIRSVEMSRYNWAFRWDSLLVGKNELAYVDTPEEQSVSLGRMGVEGIATYSYKLGEAQAMAVFSNGETAVACHPLGQGRVYLFGVAWRDVIQRNQLNKDFHAQRVGSNGYEPSADAFPLFVRAAVVRQRGLAVWKHTIPGNYESVLIPTHDCDSRTAYDSMHFMSDYEAGLGLHSHFFLTVHYYRDKGYLSAFYDSASIAKAKLLLAAGHTVGSHSIGHFPDFNRTERFPLTVTTREAYHPHHNMETKITSDGSTWGEVVLSKQILQADLNNQVRSFRSGHLCVNDNIPEAEAEGGYSFSSCYTSPEVLSEFPFFERERNDWTGRQTTVLQIPLHFSDVFNTAAGKMDSTNWRQKPAVWLTLLNKLRRNYAPAVVLIHPNREWKMEAEKMLVDSMDRSAVGLFNFEDYGDFWEARRELTFSYETNDSLSHLTLHVKKTDIERNWNMSFVVEKTDGVLPTTIDLQDEGGRQYELAVRRLSATRLLVSLVSPSGIGLAHIDNTTTSPSYTLTGLPVNNSYRGVVVKKAKKYLCK